MTDRSAAPLPLSDLIADLVAEQQALDDVMTSLGDDDWATATPSPGWTVGDQIGHLTYFDGTAAQAITDPDGFQLNARSLLTMVGKGGDTLDDLTLGRLRVLSTTERLEAWRFGRNQLAAAAAGLANDARVPWYGPSMGARSFLTARLMEVWAHGQDIVDATDGHRPVSDRLRHIAQLGVITRGWSYANRRMEAPEVPIDVVLDAASGAVWTWGPGDATEVVRGTAEDFCLVVTQRRHVDDTSLATSGEAARDWMVKAQAFAGPPTAGPNAGRF